ncbi:response regulator transcription factor [Rurimicrobium arvi]|uniref:Response regulator transcription factor n=1 Tax=Rurimicrobium arvi TaxID=2049916 RepID=A0ABP8MU86_9BACT
MISVFIVEDRVEQQIYLRAILGSDHNFELLGIAKYGHEAQKQILKYQPDVVMIDIGLPDISGIDVVRNMKPLCENTKFMVLTVHEEDENVFEALKAGAQSYIVKKSKPYQILDGIRELHAGESPISSCIAVKLLQYFPSKIPEAEQSADVNVTPKEKDILDLLAKGHSYLEISSLCYISVKTLKWHIHNIYRKLHANNRTEALNKYFGR